MEADLGVLAAAQPPPRQQGDLGTPTVENSQVGEAGRPGGWVLVLSLLLRDCVTSDRFPPLSGPHFSHLYDERGWAKEWFQTMLDEALESQRGVLRGCFGGRGSRRQMGQIKVRPHFFQPEWPTGICSTPWFLHKQVICAMIMKINTEPSHVAEQIICDNSYAMLSAIILSSTCISVLQTRKLRR